MFPRHLSVSAAAVIGQDELQGSKVKPPSPLRKGRAGSSDQGENTNHRKATTAQITAAPFIVSLFIIITVIITVISIIIISTIVITNVIYYVYLCSFVWFSVCMYDGFLFWGVMT